MKELKLILPSDVPLDGKEGFAAYFIIYHFVFGAQQIGPQAERYKDVNEHRLTDGTKGGSVNIYAITHSLCRLFCCDSEAQTLSNLDSPF